MSNREHLRILKKGIKTWNKWREDNRNINPDFVGADLSGADLRNGNFYKANFHSAKLIDTDYRGSTCVRAVFKNANLTNVNFNSVNCNACMFSKAKLINASMEATKLNGATFYETNMEGANLKNSEFRNAYLSKASLVRADLSKTNFTQANLYLANLNYAKVKKSNLSNSNLSHTQLIGADLRESTLVNTIFVNANLDKANISRCKVYGISAWDVNLNDTVQTDLIISSRNGNLITVDNLDMAQFIYLILHNKNIRGMIDTLGKKAILILGRFTPERKGVLEALKEKLRQLDYLPLLFDFERASERDLSETVTILAHMSKYIIADISDAKSIIHELQMIVPNLPSVTVFPIIHCSCSEYAMFEHLKRYPWVSSVHKYNRIEALLNAIDHILVKNQKDTKVLKKA